MNRYAAVLAVLVTGVVAWHGAELWMTQKVSSVCLDESRGVFAAFGNVFLCRQYKPPISLDAERKQAERLERNP